MAPAISTCQRSQWSLAPTHHCGRIMPWRTPPPTSPCSLPTQSSCALWANSGRPAACTPDASPRGSSWSAWPWGYARKWRPTASGRFPSAWMSSQSAIITMTTSCHISGSMPCLRSLSSFGTSTKVARSAWGWDIAPLKREGVKEFWWATAVSWSLVGYRKQVSCNPAGSWCHDTHACTWACFLWGTPGTASVSIHCSPSLIPNYYSLIPATSGTESTPPHAGRHMHNVKYSYIPKIAISLPLVSEIVCVHGCMSLRKASAGTNKGEHAWGWMGGICFFSYADYCIWLTYRAAGPNPPLGLC